MKARPQIQRKTRRRRGLASFSAILESEGAQELKRELTDFACDFAARSVTS